MSILLLIVIFFFLLFSGIPIGLVLGISSLAYLIASGNPMMLQMLPERMYNGLDQFVLLAIPFFMLAGDIMNRAGISDRLMKFSNIVIGRVRGGLAQVNVLSSILFAGITGVALGDIAALGSVFIPMMEKQGYDRKFSAAVTAASSIIGPIIPPSVTIVFYAAIMRVSVGGMFVGAIIPGILIGVTDMLIVYYLAKKRNYPKVSILYALIVGFFIFRSLTIKDIIASLKYAVYGTTKIIFLIAGGYVLSWIIGMENVTGSVEKLFFSFSHSKFVLILFINFFFLVAGMFGETGIAIILFGPILAPLAAKFGIGDFQFGVMIIINVALGYLTPPVGNVLFATADLARVKSMELGIELLPFIAINYVFVMMIGMFSEISMFLPRLFGF